MKKFVCRFYGVLGLFCLAISTAYGQDEFQVIESRIAKYLKEDVDISQLHQEVRNNALSLQYNGGWSAIDYSSQAETSWAPLGHLNRVKQFALVLALNEANEVAQNKLAVQTIHALRYWLQQNPRSSNWFQNDIASPTALGEIMLLLKNRNALPPALQDSLLNLMNQGDVVRAIGANKSDIAIHMMYRACISRDKALMDSAVKQVFMPISLGNKEGLQYDYSYRQHGPQLQIASYGQVFLSGEYKVASWLLGTTYAIQPEKLKILDQYLTGTYLKTIRGRYIDFNTEGRGIARNDILDKINITSKGGKHSLLGLAKEVNPENAVVLEKAEQRILQLQGPSFDVEPAHIHFYKGDYTLHNRPAYSFNVRTVSKRTIRTEYGNKENLTGKFLPDGSTNIQRSGAEYFNIMPVWEWDKIPGITGRDYAADQRTTIEWGERGVGSFVGGASDGKYGTTVYQLDYNEVTAKKAWFFFDDEVVCLGTDINSFAKEPIATTINQAWQKGPVKVFNGGKLINVNGRFIANDVKWIWHDSIAYYFPNQGKISLTNEKQKGSWNLINANRSKSTVEGKVFKLWFDHGVDPVKQSYAYIVKPGISEKELMGDKGLAMSAMRTLSAISILRNTPEIQAVEHVDLQMVQVVFYEAGSLTTQNFSIAVDQPCVLLIKAIKTRNPILYLSDPTQKLTDLHVTFSSEFLKIMEPVPISLPQGDHKGATVSFQFN
ncbi:polysaccharide lyase family 8 super-sandwich domain-containing protein [Pedobacter nyackensis]|uniref:Chondroitin AC lyase n=1 Tax=Pedobacter nyackensis TaxID=475255 RepID=A0A1W2F290_9SPHI|nr:polysaccharide lyase family 8 super-sandwich domain-containing protein [Pedobacter nyackensis]SMD16073.1 chondroitin AC lyase [Pedobacter nyackensis]